MRDSAIEFVDLGRQYRRLAPQIEIAITNVLRRGDYILGVEVGELESRLGEFAGVSRVITCANGTDALQLALMALKVGPGDVVFCPSFTFAATAEVIALKGATPFFVDIDISTFNVCCVSLKRSIDAARSSGLKPKAIISVDLFGLPADHDGLKVIAKAENLFLVSDCAQSFGAKYAGRATVSYGDIATTSFFPAKPLGCYGDGGAIFTSNESLANELESLRVHGRGVDKYENVRVGLNSRLDTIQAAVLLEKLKVYPEEIELRGHVARYYNDRLHERISRPLMPRDDLSVWAQYTILLPVDADRARVQMAISKSGVPSAVYYRCPLHLQQAYSGCPCDPNGLGESERASQLVLSLPMHPYLNPKELGKIVQVVNNALS